MTEEEKANNIKNVFINLDKILDKCSEFRSGHDNYIAEFKKLCIEITQGNDDFENDDSFRSYVQKLVKDEHIYEATDGKLKYYVASIEGEVFKSRGGYQKYNELLDKKEALINKQYQSVINTNKISKKTMCITIVVISVGLLVSMCEFYGNHIDRKDRAINSSKQDTIEQLNRQLQIQAQDLQKQELDLLNTYVQYRMVQDTLTTTKILKAIHSRNDK